MQYNAAFHLAITPLLVLELFSSVALPRALYSSLALICIKRFRISCKTLCRFFLSFRLNSLCDIKQTPSRLCVGLAAMQMFDMLEKKRNTLYLYLLMTMICNVVLTVSSADTNGNNSMYIGEKGEKVTK